MKVHRFSHNLDDSRPLDDESEDILDIQFVESRQPTNHILSESTNTKPITKMKKISKQ
jgi:hypothetical protein